MEHLFHKCFSAEKVDHLIIYQVNYLKLYHAALSRARIPFSFSLCWPCGPAYRAYLSIPVRLEVCLYSTLALYSFTQFFYR